MNTTLNKIKEYRPCVLGWRTLLKSLNKTEADDEPIALAYILKSNGIEDAVWCLRCFDHKEYCLFLADVADSVLHIFEDKNPEDKRPRQAIAAIRLFEQGEITRQELRDAADAADADADAADAAAYAAYAAYAAADADADAADAAAYAAYAAYAAADAAADARQKQWDTIEALFVQHFCIEGAA